MNSWQKVQLGSVADVKLSNVDKKTKENERAIRLCNGIKSDKNGQSASLDMCVFKRVSKKYVRILNIEFKIEKI